MKMISQNYLEILKEKMKKSQSKRGSTGPRVEELPPDCKGGEESFQKRCSMHLHFLDWPAHTSAHSANVLYIFKKKQPLFQ
jgi:hypothetical protein